MKKPSHDNAVAIDKQDDAMTVPTRRLENVAKLIALARILVENTSDANNHAPEPIPTLKNSMYMAREKTAKVPFVSADIKLKDCNNNAHAIPPTETNINGRRPFTSN